MTGITVRSPGGCPTLRGFRRVGIPKGRNLRSCQGVDFSDSWGSLQESTYRDLTDGQLRLLPFVD